MDLICQGQPKSASPSPDPFATLRAYMRPMEAAGDSRFFKATSLNGACPYSFCARRTLLPLSERQRHLANSHLSPALNDKEGKQELNSHTENSFSLQMMPELPPPYGAAAVGESEILFFSQVNRWIWLL